MDSQRRTATITLGIALLWQLYVVGSAWFNASAMYELFQGLGASLPIYAEAFFATYRYWPLVSLLLVVLAIDVLRRAAVNSTYYGFTLIFILGTTLLMSVWSNESCFRPFLYVTRTVR